MKKILSLFVATLFVVGTFAQTEWKVDPYHSSLNFDIGHNGISIVNGKFLEYEGNLTTDGEGLENAVFDFVVDVSSINTNVEPRDNHLRSADFFEVEKYPNMTFKSTKLETTDKEDEYLLHGKLTIKDVTKDVVFNVKYGGIAKNDKGQKLGLKATTTLNRFDYNVNYDPTSTTIARDVNLIIHLQFGDH